MWYNSCAYEHVSCEQRVALYRVFISTTHKLVNGDSLRLGSDMKKISLGAQLEDEIVSKYRLGATRVALMDEYSIGETVVRRILREHGVLRANRNTIDSENKRCTNCKEVKPLDGFRKSPKGALGRRSACTRCESAANRKWCSSNLEKRRERDRAYAKAQGPEYLRKRAEKERGRRADMGDLYRQKERDRNIRRRESRMDYNKKYYQENAETLRTYQSQWRKENPERRDEYKRVYRSRKLGLETTLTLDEWNDILETHSWACVYCGKSGKMVKEHWIPVSRGGGYTKENIVPSCATCNSRKGDRTGEEYLALLKEGYYET